MRNNEFPQHNNEELTLPAVEEKYLPVKVAPAGNTAATPEEPEELLQTPEYPDTQASDTSSQPELPATVATVTADTVTFATDVPAPETLPADGARPAQLPVATASPEGGVRMLVPVDGNGDYLTAGQVEKLLHAAYMRGRNEAVAAKIEADTTIAALTDRDNQLFTTRPSVWERNFQ